MIRRIAITQRVVDNQTYQEKRDALAQDWTTYLQQLLPRAIILPVPNRLTDVCQWADWLKFDALILSNGNDWGQAPERDRTETRLVAYCRQHKLPVLGVCRGLQALNKILGGSLATDLSANPGQSHVAQNHSVDLCATPFKDLADPPSVAVNSFHNQGVLKSGLAQGLRPFALAAGDVVEGFYHQSEAILGLQWHPERADPAKDFSKNLLDTFLTQGAFWLK